MRAKFGVLEQTQGLHLQTKFHLNVLILSASGGQNPQFWSNFDIFGSSCTFYRGGPNLVSYSRPTVYVYLRNFVSIGLFCRAVAAENPNFCRFWTSAFSGVAIWQQLNTVHNYRPSPIQRYQIVSILPRLHGEIGRTMSDVQKRDEQQTDKQKNSTFLAAPAAGEIRPHRAWHGDRGP